MDLDKEILELCSEVFKVSGMKSFSHKIDEYLHLQDSKSFQDCLDKGLEWIETADGLKQRAFSFGTGFTMNKYFIVTVEARYNDNGEPVIVINEILDENVTFKDNPIRNLFLVYPNEELRDKDYERVRFVMR